MNQNVLPFEAARETRPLGTPAGIEASALATAACASCTQGATLTFARRDAPASGPDAPTPTMANAITVTMGTTRRTPLLKNCVAILPPIWFSALSAEICLISVNYYHHMSN